MKKVFGPAEHSSRLLEVESEASGKFSLCVNDERGAYHTVFIAPSDVPALALAILEAAGLTVAKGDVKQDSFEDVMIDASLHLKCAIRLQERATAEAKEQAELEAEALELFNASRVVRGLVLIEWVSVTKSERDEWLAVARKAREMRAEK